VLLLLGQALYRLLPLALEPLLDGSMSALQWALYLGWVVFNAYAEGYRGFQRSFSPRVVARAIHLAHHPRPSHVLLAPLFCMALFHAKRKNLILAWGLTSAIVVVIVAVRQLPQPWRGIVDGGVVVGLVWGALSLAWLLGRVWLQNEVPEHDSLPFDDQQPAS
jgi:hypothetical protein